LFEKISSLIRFC